MEPYGEGLLTSVNPKKLTVSYSKLLRSEFSAPSLSWMLVCSMSICLPEVSILSAASQNTWSHCVRLSTASVPHRLLLDGFISQYLFLSE